VVTHQLQAERRTVKARRPKTDVVPLNHATNQTLKMDGIPNVVLYVADWDLTMHRDALYHNFELSVDKFHRQHSRNLFYFVTVETAWTAH